MQKTTAKLYFNERTDGEEPEACTLQTRKENIMSAESLAILRQKNPPSLRYTPRRRAPRGAARRLPELALFRRQHHRSLFRRHHHHLP